jgi:hypothetical protein
MVSDREYIPTGIFRYLMALDKIRLGKMVSDREYIPTGIFRYLMALDKIRDNL